MSIKEQVLRIIVDQYGSGYGEDSIVLNASGIPQTEQIDLIMRLEDELKVHIPDEDAEKLSTIKDIIEYLKKKEEK